VDERLELGGLDADRRTRPASDSDASKVTRGDLVSNRALALPERERDFANGEEARLFEHDRTSAKFTTLGERYSAPVAHTCAVTDIGANARSATGWVDAIEKR
jgi:hypothetical protein